MIWYCVDDVAWSTFFINITEDVIYKGVAPTCELGGWSDMREEIARVDYIKEFWCISMWVWLKACVHYFISNFYFSPNNDPSKAMKNVFYFI